jgi:HPr kinase/phosphorylase
MRAGKGKGTGKGTGTGKDTGTGTGKDTGTGTRGGTRRSRGSGEAHAVPLSVIIELMGLMRVAGGHLDLSTIMVTTAEVNRPGLQLTGYTEHFSSDRLQIIGWTETAYLSGLDPEVRAQRLDDYFALGFPALVVARGLHVMPDMVQAADRHDVPVFATDVLTSEFAGSLTWLLIHALAPRTVIPGGLVDVYGEGVLIVGDPGIGQSETALELVRRGHRLISDDRVEVRRISEDHLRGRAPEGQRHLIDVPGVGFIDVEELFGIGAIKPDARVTLVVALEVRDLDREYERVGRDDRTTDVFGVDVTLVTIPVQPGRNLAVIIEAAALNHRIRGMGYNAAEDLLSGGA